MMVSRMLAPCPRRLSAAVLMSPPSVLTPPGVVGCSIAVSRSSCLRTSSHSTGTAVRFCGITAPLSIVAPPLYGGVNWIALPLTSCGERITAKASAGTLNLRSNQKVIIACCGCGSIRSTLPTRTPLMRTSSPTKSPVLLSK